MPTQDAGTSGNAGDQGTMNPLADAAEQIGDRWSLLVVDALLAGPLRFGDLLEGIDKLAPNILSRRLKQLEQDGLIVAEPYSRRPLRHTYRLTATGDELAGVLRLLRQWAASRRTGPAGEAIPSGLVHQACGTPVEARWACPTCDEIVENDQASELLWV